VVVARNGALVYERYFAAAEMYGYAVPYNANTLHDIASITKGVVALLIRIALDRGWLSDLDAPIMSFFPEYADLRCQSALKRDPDRRAKGTLWSGLCR
jgi:CubicO group peptidase (beta-lactamase class C family)